MNTLEDRPEDLSGRADEYRDEHATTKSTKVPNVDLNGTRG